jgi:hypothetical protein
MNASKNRRWTAVSNAATLTEIGDFWDAHSLSDHWEQTREVQFQVNVQQRRRITLDPEIYTGIESEARERGVTPETLANLWLLDHLRLRRSPG